MMKRIFALVLAVCMTLTLLPVSALAARSSMDDRPMAENAMGEEALDRAEGSAARPAGALAAGDASVTMKGYELRNKAVNGLIELDSDVTLTSVFAPNSNTNMTLDLKGHTVTFQYEYSSSNKSCIDVYSNVTLTIQDSLSGGKITDSGMTGSSFSANGLIHAKGTLNLLGGTIESLKTNCVRVGDNSQGGMVILDGADLVCGYTMKSGIEIYQNAKATATAEIKSGTITSTGTSGYGVNVGRNHSATISGGTITAAYCGVQISGGDNTSLTLTGGTINATGAASTGVHVNGASTVTMDGVKIESKAKGLFLNGASNVTISGDTEVKGTTAITCNNGWSDNENSSLTINGGTFTFTGKGASAISQQGTTKVSKPEICGGTFLDKDNNVADVSQYVVEGKLQDENGTVVELNAETATAQVGETFYATLASALAAAAEGENKEVTILKAGTYDAPTGDVVLSDGVTLKAAADVEVIFTGSFTGTTKIGGKNVNRIGKNVTLENLTFRDDKPLNYNVGDNLTVRNCHFIGGGNDTTAMYIHTPSITVTGCTFEGYRRGYYTCGDNHAIGTITFTDKIFTNVLIPFDGYWGKKATDGTALTVTGNTFSDGSYVQLWDYTQCLNSSAEDRDNTALDHVTVKNNTGNYQLVLVHNNWRWNTDSIDTDAANKVFSNWVDVAPGDQEEDIKEITVQWTGEGEMPGFEHHVKIDRTKVNAQGNPAPDPWRFYHLPVGQYTATVTYTNGVVKTQGLTVAAPSVGEAQTMTLTTDKYVAQVGEDKYGSLQDAITAANAGSNKTVELLDDVTVDVWNQMWNLDGVTIDGKGNTLTIKDFESNGNGDYITYGAVNLIVKDLTVDQTGAGTGGFSVGTGSKLENVKVIGGSYAVLTGSDVTITGCTFENVKHAIYTDDDETGTGVVVTNNTFTGGRAIVLRNNEVFTGNTVNAGEYTGTMVTVNSADTTVTGNKFTGDGALKLHRDAEIENNAILCRVETNTGVTADLSGNYWGESEPAGLPEGVTVMSRFTQWDDETKTASVPVVTSAAVAKIGEEYYPSLQAAFAAADPGDTVKVLADVTVASAINPRKAITIEGVTKADGSKPVISGNGGLLSFTQDSATVKNLELRATGNSYYIYHSAGAQTGEVKLTVDGCDFTMAEGVTDVGNLIMTEGNDKTKTPVIFTNNKVLAHSRAAFAGPGDNSVFTGNVIDLMGEHYGDSRTGVIGLTATAGAETITITGNVFKNANRVLGVDNSAANVAEKLTFKNNAFINCRWALELNPAVQSGFDLGENYYSFNGEVGVPKVEDAGKSGSHTSGVTEYAPAAGQAPAVAVSSYYESYDEDSGLSNLVTFAAEVIDVTTGAAVRYATVDAAIAVSNPGDTLKLLTRPEGTVTIPNDKAVRFAAAEEVDLTTVDVDFQALVANTGSPQFAIYGGVEAGLAGEAKLRVPGASYTGYTSVYLYKDWTLSENVVLPSRNASTTAIYTQANVTIDLAGHTVSQSKGTGWNGYPAVAAYTGDLTVKDSVGNGKIVGATIGADVYPGKKLTLESGTIASEGDRYEAWADSYGTVVRMYGGEFAMGGGTLAAADNADTMSGTIAFVSGGSDPFYADATYKLTMTGGVIKNVTKVVEGNNGFHSIAGSVNTETKGKITYAITGGTFDMDLRGATDAAKNPYLGEGYVSPEDADSEGSFTVAVCQHTATTVTREDEIAATCTADGSYVEVTTCNGCGRETRANKTIEKPGHSFTNYVSDGNATCAADGTKTATCDRKDCDETHTVTDEGSKTAHNQNGVVQYKAPTCTEPGIHGGSYCTVCEAGKAEALAEIAALGEHEMTAWAFDETNHWHVCAHCGAVDEAETPAAHTWVQGTVSGGQRTDTCVCGAERTVSVPTGGGSSSRPTPTPAPQPQPPEEDLNEPDVPLTEKPFTFTDVKTGDWFYDAVQFVYQHNVMLGVNAAGTLFAPGGNTTRASVAQLLYRMEKEPDADPADFLDVTDSAWYAEAVNWADANGLMIGFDDGTFRPDDNVTRGQLVTVLYRYAGYMGLERTAEGDLSAFVDEADVADWAEEAMRWAVGCGLIGGRNGGRLAPNGSASRSEMAAILRRFLELK